MFNLLNLGVIGAGIFRYSDYKYYQLGIALLFLKMENKELTKTEKNRVFEYAKKLELDVDFDSFEDLASIVKFKINDLHQGEKLFNDKDPINSINKIFNIGYFNKSGVINIIWMLINLAYADGVFSDNEQKILNKIAEDFNIENSIIEELKDCAKTLICLDEKNEWIETTDEPYKKIKAVKDEIEKDNSLVATMVASIIKNIEVA
ncbi:TerB family tellurite resistance protein [Campylobacter concisus]|jgi:hypothetical protein|uniref:TerB family tellurite resistance protein n=1 Tax=Campylobacter concisus TaxID=199 RepID=UPI000CD9CAE4|nr:TerB family tellurite resistance protein [Campylobacter concisus]